MVSLVLCLAFVGSAYAQEDPFNGTWKVDLAKSSGEGLPAAELVVLEVADNVEPGRGKVMMVRMDERSELRIGQNANGKMSAMIMRQVSEDGMMMRIVWYEGDGSIHQELHLDKQ